VRSILRGEGLRALAAAAASPRALLAFDFDGTLAPIVRRPGGARLPARTRRLLRALAARRPVAILSGRARPDLLARLDGLPLRFAVGNHGAEWGAARERAGRARNARVAALLAARLAGRPGVVIEDKGLSVAVHFRAAPDRAAAARAVARALRGVRGVRAFGGKAVVNVLPAGGPDKGVALRRMLRAARAPAALYVGDDLTDEDAFRVRDPRLVAVRVGRARRSAAPWALDRQRDVDALLGALLHFTAPTVNPAMKRSRKTL
jgi:trehalose 6-phosphate phosphatase